MTSPLRRKRPTTAPATAWETSADARPRAAIGLGAFFWSLLCVGLPLAWAGSADSPAPDPMRWSAAHSRPAMTAPGKRPLGRAKLQWGRAAASGPSSSPAVGDLDRLPHGKVGRALHEAEEQHAGGEIQLMSLDAPADDPAADPFQDEVAPDEGEALEDEALDDEALDAGSPEAEETPADEYGGFDVQTFAQRGAAPNRSESSDDFDDEMRSMESDLPSMGEEYAEAGVGEPERCPSPRDLKPINQITHRIAAEPGLFPQECALSDAPFAPRNFSPVVYTWKASALCHKPLYFQQPKLERYGHTFGPILTPILSIGHFFVMVPCLPYNMGLEPPWECVYPLGWYRPGDCAPYTLGPVPLSLRGAAVQGFITTGLWFLFP